MQRVPASSPLSLAFYVRRHTSEINSSENFRLVRLPLGRRPDTKTIIRDLLKSCELPTDFVDAIKSTTQQSPSKTNQMNPRYTNPNTGDSFYGRAYDYEDENQDTYRRVRKSKTLL